MRLVSSALLTFFAMLGAAHAAGSSGSFAGSPDPRLKDATPYVMQLVVFDQCLIQQSRLQGKTREAVHTPCSCYAKRTVGGMSKSDQQFLRDNGFFNDETRVKALANIESCGLKRP